jgi:hypothetical protein
MQEPAMVGRNGSADRAPRKLLSNKDALDAAQEFLLAAAEGVQQFKERYSEIAAGDLSISFGPGGIAIARTKRLDEVESRLAKTCVKVLSNRVADESDILAIAWANFFEGLASRSDEGHSFEFATGLLRQLDEAAAAEPIYVMPNCAIVLAEDVRNLHLGQVQIRITEDILPDLKQSNWQTLSTAQGTNFRVLHDGLTEMPARDGELTKIAHAVLQLGFPSSCWRVSVNALHGTVSEEALGLVNIAMSLVSLYYPRVVEDAPPSGFGVRENHPTLMIESQQPSIMLDRGQSSAKGSLSGMPYVIGKAQKEHFERIGLKQIAECVYNASLDSVAARVAQGFCWLSRGRQAGSCSERLLFFVTAMEALLSSTDPNAPIAKTIARHAAVIIFDDPKEWAVRAKEIQMLYGLRSGVMRTGRRNVSKLEANRSQELAEALYRSVLDNYDIGRKFEDFFMQLSDTCFGLPWLPNED